TGSGKTNIAIMLIKELSPIVRFSLNNGGKRTIILVKTNELARQHEDVMKKHLDLKIKVYCGSLNILLQDRDRWNEEFENNQVLIFTVQRFLNLLDHNLFSLHQINLLIFDECHHATGDGGYVTIMKKYDSCPHCPRIIGLTASISGQKIEPNKLQKIACQLENIYHARIETGSNQEEIIQHSTSVKSKYTRCTNFKTYISEKNRAILNIFKIVENLSEELNKYLKTKKNQNESANNSLQIVDQLNRIEIQCRTLDQLKSHLDNIIHIGYELGLYGLYLGLKSLTNYLKSKLPDITIIDKDLCVKIRNQLDSLIENLTEENKKLCSAKVIQLEELIKNNTDGQCIVFVDRVYTAAFLCQVLSEKFTNSIKIKYVAGSKAYIDETSSSNKYQREVIKEFRDKDIRVLISTAIIEEGVDIPECNLVIRFNKPQNFSSYMQSKGRARARDALFIILRDEPDLKTFQMNNDEYENYEYMEKMLKKNFKTEIDLDQSLDDNTNYLTPYSTDKQVKIDGIRAVQIIYQYCAVLGNGEILSPRFCTSKTPCNTFKCILSMPINCPIQKDITCVNKTKRLCKQECCLEMVELLHKNGELDEYCLPILPERSLTLTDDDDDEAEKVSIEIFPKQISYFFNEYNHLSTDWYLYRINISNNKDLGFIVPYQLMQLPIFTLYGRDEELRIEIVYLKTINFNRCKDYLGNFCRYIFEQVFDNMNIESESNLEFDIKSSNFKLLPCLLTEFDDIDYERMTSICNRKNESIHHPSELNDDELYCISGLSEKQFFINISDQSLLKRVTDQQEHKKSLDTVESYFDNFQRRFPDIVFRKDFFMATLKDFKKPKINYLKISTTKDDKQSTYKPSYYPVEILRYAPLNQLDFQLISKLQNILARITQLYYIEQFKQLLINNIQPNTVDQIPINVKFNDCLKKIFSSTESNVLPLIYFDYNVLLKNSCKFQITSDLLFQAITRRSADENTDMENLEILGDCFLKLSMSLSLFHQYPMEGVGKMTSKKDKQVSNKNLYRLALKKNLENYLNVSKPIYGGPEANWIPPGYTIINDNVTERYTTQKAKDKAIADMMEALIGAFLVSTDYITTIKFMDWLGLDVIPQYEQNIKTPSVLRSGLSDTMIDISSEIQNFFTDHAFEEIENKIKYAFKNKGYLIAAFTHPSYVNNRLTQCYERLEYLGDAILDFLVIRCVFVDHYKHVTPKHVTDIRQDLSNNGRLSYIFVSCDLHKKILHLSPYLSNQITSYVESETISSKDQSLDAKLGKDIDKWADLTAPKTFADVFEALVGAIFLDSGYSLNTVWNIIEPLLRQYINQSVKHPNLSPIRSYFENGGKPFVIEKPKDGQGNFTCKAKLPDKSENTLLFGKKDVLTSIWYLYQIHIHSRTENNVELGFIVPSGLTELPMIHDGLLTIKIIFIKEINYLEKRSLFEQFSKHIFENVFEYTLFDFNIQSSTFKLLPCLLTSCKEIDFNRMLNICHRQNKSIEHPSYLSDTELYAVWYLETKPLVCYLSNISQTKRASDRKTNTQTYADYYHEIIPNVHIEKDILMGTMKVINKIKISLNIQENLIKSSEQRIYYYPIELLHYAPLNQKDFQLISRLPPLLVRIVQLYHLERLRKLFIENLKCYSFIKSNEVSFKDCLEDYMQIVS
ncbi:unnamed protein product, partial [Adineta steineri]